MSGSKIAIAVLLFLVGAGLGYLLMQGDGDADVGGAPELDGRGSEAPDLEPSPDTPRRDEIVEPLVSGPISTEVFSGEGRAVPVAVFSILVRDVEERPASGATLRMLHPWAPNDAAESALAGRDEWEMRTGADGTAGIREIPATPFRLCARHGDQLGFVHIDPQELSLPSQKVIDLKRIRRAEVTVVDRAGKPVPHARVTVGPGGFMISGSAQWTVSPSGVAAFEVGPLDPAWSNEDLTANARLGTGRYSAEAVPWAEEGVTRARIEVDRGVTLEVIVLGEEGQPHPSSKTLEWKAASKAKPELEDILVIGLPEIAGGRRREFAGGVVRVAGFKPGATMELTVEEEARCPVRETVQLPSFETVHEICLDRGAPAPCLEIPVVDAGGTPVTRGSFEVEVSYDRESDESSTTSGMVFLSAPTMTARKDCFVPDARGIITRYVDPYRSGRVKVRRFVPRNDGGPYGAMRIRYAGGGGPLDASDGEVFPELGPGVAHRLGTMELPAEAVVVSGRVLDAAGEPVSGALVNVLGAISRRPDRMGIPPGMMRGQQRRTRSEADGTFVIRTREGQSVPAGSLLCAQHAVGSVSELVPFESGDTGIELRLRGTGMLEGAIHSALPKARPHLRLHPRSGAGVGAGGAVNPLIELAAHATKDGSFSMTGLPPGIYDAQVSLLDFTLLEVSGIVIREDAVTRDPRLDGIRVGDGITQAVVRVQDPSGQPIAEASVKFTIERPGDEEKRQHQEDTDAEGRVSLHVLPDSRVDVRVRADGFRRWSGKDVTFPLDVVLDPGCRLEIVIDNAEALVTEDKGRLFEIELRRKKKEGEEARSRSVRSKSLKPAKGRVVFSGLDPGSYTATLNVGRALRIEGLDILIETMTGRGRATELGGLTIREGARTQEKRFRLTPEQLAKVFEE